MSEPPSEPPPVAGLVRAAAAGDSSAWDDIVVRFAPLLVAVTRRHRLSGEDAQDVAQTVWLRLVECLDSLREPAALAGWLVTTTRHECLRIIAARRRTTPVQTDVLADSPDLAARAEPDEHLLATERREIVLTAMGGLAPRQRELLLLLVSDPPLSYQQIGTRLGIPIGSIGPTRVRALAALRHDPHVAGLVEERLGQAGLGQAGLGQAGSGQAGMGNTRFERGAGHEHVVIR